MFETTLADARAHLGDMVNKATHGQPVAITRHGKTAVVMMSAERYEELARLQEQEDWRLVRERMARAEADPAGLRAYESTEDMCEQLGVDPDVVRRKTAALLAELSTRATG